jgi:hypothetical protein
MADSEVYAKWVDTGPPIRAEVVVHFRRSDSSCVRYERSVPLEVLNGPWIKAIDTLLNDDHNGAPMEIGERPVGQECTDHVG